MLKNMLNLKDSIDYFNNILDVRTDRSKIFGVIDIDTSSMEIENDAAEP
jgi:hypothetical protein